MNKATDRMVNYLMSRHPWFIDKISIIKNMLIVFLTATASLVGWDIRFAIPVATLTALILVLESIDAESRPKIKELQRKLGEAEARNDLIAERIPILFTGYLRVLATELGFGNEDENSERISLYIHRDDRNSFTLLGRYSANPTYENIRRSEYPDNQGCIAEGWKNGWHFDNGFPDPSNQLAEYNNYRQSKYAMDEKTCREIRMQSTVFAVLRIGSQKTGKKFAVIVVESTKQDRFDENEVQETLKSQHDFLAETIEDLREFIPMLVSAKAEEL